MEETPDPAEPLPVTPDDRAPLGVRVIAAAMLVAGVHSIVGHALNWWTEWSMSWDFSFIFIPLAWGLLRRREWARIVTEVVSFLGVILFALMVVVCFAIRDGRGLYFRSTESIWDRLGFWQGPIVCVVVAIALFRVFCTLEFGPARDWFRSPGPREPWFVGNPLRWRFSVSTMLILTALFAMVTFQAVYHPSAPYQRGERWIAKQDLSDPTYFPSGVRYRVRTSDGQGGVGSQFSNGKKLTLEYGTLAPADWNDEPTLVYLVFEEKVPDYERWERWQAIPKDSRGTQYELRIRDQPSLTLPDDAQIVEIVDDKPRTSELRITLLELWSYLSSDAMTNQNADRSLEALEAFIGDLRKRVAERDAMQSSTP